MAQPWKEKAATSLGGAAGNLADLARGIAEAARAAAGAARESVWDAFRVEPEPAPGGSLGETEWETVPQVAERLRLLMCGGDPGRYRNFIDYAVARWGGKLPREKLSALCLGCGAESYLENLLAETGRFRRVVVIDPDRKRLYEARQRGLEGVEYVRVDPEREPFPDEFFHVVLSHGALQGVAELERIFAEAERVLDPQCGLFVAREYVGPSRLQYTPEQMALAGALLALLPERLRVGGGGVKQALAAPDLSYMISRRPGTAVRSEDIPGIARNRMKVVEEIALGGTVLAPLLAGIAHNFSGGDPEAAECLAPLVEAEAALVRSGLLPSDHAFIIARRVLHGPAPEALVIEEDVEEESEERA